MKHGIIASMIGLALCTGCPRPLWLPDRNLDRLVSREEVIGTWFMTTNSLRLLSRYGFNADTTNKYSIIFRENGSLSFNSVLAGFDAITSHNIDGNWELQHDENGFSNNRAKNILIMSLVAEDGSYSTSLNFDKDKSGIILWEFYGDPDMWEFIEYKKAEHAPPAGRGEAPRP